MLQFKLLQFLDLLIYLLKRGEELEQEISSLTSLTLVLIKLKSNLLLGNFRLPNR